MREGTWIWGRHPVLEALRARKLSRLLMVDVRKDAGILKEIRGTATGAGIEVEWTSSAILETVTGTSNNQGVAGLMAIKLDLSVAEILSETPRDQDRFLVILDQIQDPHNLGSLMRSSSAAGVQAMIMPERRSAPLSGTVAKVSAGAMSHLPVARVTNLGRAIHRIKEAGIWTIGLDETSGVPIYSIDLTGPIALVVGGEANGLRRLTTEYCDLLACLPMYGVLDSLNAAVAGSIAMFEVVRQRTMSRRR